MFRWLENVMSHLGQFDLKFGNIKWSRREDGMRGSIEQNTDQKMKTKTMAFVMSLMMILIGWLIAARSRFAAGT